MTNVTLLDNVPYDGYGNIQQEENRNGVTKQIKIVNRSDYSPE